MLRNGGIKMILVDKQIKQRIQAGELIIDGYQNENISNSSYDLTLNSICMGEEQVEEYELKPSETVFVKSEEKLKIPNDLLGRIAEKNSRMRQGLKVDGPHYQPGHITYAFLRVHNISDKTIILNKGMKIAQIFFEQLSEEPEHPYDAGYQGEERYIGLGSYREEYQQQIKNEIDKQKNDLEEMSQKIYANVITIMGVLVAVFSLLSINYQAFTKANVDYKFILTMNLTLCLSIVTMLGVIFLFINKSKKNSEKVMWVFIAILIILAIATLLALFR